MSNNVFNLKRAKVLYSKHDVKEMFDYLGQLEMFCWLLNMTALIISYNVNSVDIEHDLKISAEIA